MKQIPDVFTYKVWKILVSPLNADKRQCAQFLHKCWKGNKINIKGRLGDMTLSLAAYNKGRKHRKPTPSIDWGRITSKRSLTSGQWY